MTYHEGEMGEKIKIWVSQHAHGPDSLDCSRINEHNTQPPFLGEVKVQPCTSPETNGVISTSFVYIISASPCPYFCCFCVVEECRVTSGYEEGSFSSESPPEECHSSSLFAPRTDHDTACRSGDDDDGTRPLPLRVFVVVGGVCVGTDGNDAHPVGDDDDDDDEGSPRPPAVRSGVATVVLPSDDVTAIPTTTTAVSCRRRRYDHDARGSRVSRPRRSITGCRGTAVGGVAVPVGTVRVARRRLRW